MNGKDPKIGDWRPLEPHPEPVTEEWEDRTPSSTFSNTLPTTITADEMLAAMAEFEAKLGKLPLWHEWPPFKLVEEEEPLRVSWVGYGGLKLPD